MSLLERWIVDDTGLLNNNIDGASAALVGAPTFAQVPTSSRAVVVNGSSQYAAAPARALLGDSWEVPAGGGQSAGFTNTGLSYDAAAGHLIIGDHLNSRVVYTTLAGAYVRDFGVNVQPQGVAVDPSRSQSVWVASTLSNIISRYTSAGVLSGDTIDTGNPVNGIAIDAASDEIYAVRSTTNTIRVYDLALGTLKRTITVGALPASMTLGEDIDGCFYDAASATLWAIYDNLDQMIQIDPATGTILRRVAVTNAPEDLVIINGEIYHTSDAFFHGAVASANRVYKLTGALPATQDRTICGWFNVVSHNGTESLLVHGDPVGGIGYGIYVLSSGDVRGFVRDGATVVNFSRTPVSALIGRWTHLALVIDRAADAARLYIDGVQSGSDVDISGVTQSIEAFARMGIMASPDGDQTRHAHGQAFDIRRYNAALPTADVLAAMSPVTPESQLNIAVELAAIRASTLDATATITDIQSDLAQVASDVTLGATAAASARVAAESADTKIGTPAGASIAADIAASGGGSESRASVAFAQGPTTSVDNGDGTKDFFFYDPGADTAIDPAVLRWRHNAAGIRTETEVLLT